MVDKRAGTSALNKVVPWYQNSPCALYHQALTGKKKKKKVLKELNNNFINFQPFRVCNVLCDEMGRIQEALYSIPKYDGCLKANHS